MNIDYQDHNVFEVDYIYRFQTIEKCLENQMCSQDLYTNYKAGSYRTFLWAQYD